VRRAAVPGGHRTLAKEPGVPVLVDPALIDDFAKYRGATAITPNRTEAEKATGLRTHQAADAAHNASNSPTRCSAARRSTRSC
jgi:bifunctional ADP-heptose synthase (sugar kinase/adenylyltransferase)